MTSIDLNTLDERMQQLQNIGNTIDQNLDELTSKYNKYYMKYYRLNILTLILSALITFINALTIITADNFGSNIIHDYIGKVLSLIFSTIMTLCTSIIRFRNYRDKLEKIKENIYTLKQIKTLIDIDCHNHQVQNIPDIMKKIGSIELRI